MNKKKKGLLLINLGSPDSPDPKDVKKYLLEFLTDPRVIDFSWLKRNVLVRGIIVPARYKNSAATYKVIWDEKRGSPLIYHAKDLTAALSAELKNRYIVKYAMRYQNPSIESVIKDFAKEDISELVVFPLYPQYASSSTGTVLEEVHRILRSGQNIPSSRMISYYYDHPMYIDAIIEQTKDIDLKSFDHILFSYHGLPERHLRKADPSGNYCMEDRSCCDQIGKQNESCYRAHCFSTTRAVVAKLGLSENEYTQTFQSRLGKEVWLEPYTGEFLKKLAAEGKKKILVFCPSFTADCLETLFEIQHEYQEEFQEVGGESLTLVKSLNSDPTWVKAIEAIIEE